MAEHGPVVMRVCRALLGPADAEDAWAETFVSALQAYPRLRPESNVRGWLVTIAHRKAIDVIRARQRAPRRPPISRNASTADEARTRRRAVGGARRPPRQATGGRRLPPPRRAALRRGRRAARTAARRRPGAARPTVSPPCAPRIEEPRHEHRPVRHRPHRPTPPPWTACTPASSSAAAGDGLLDVSYRTVDSPLGALLLAATPAGLVRVAFPCEDHDTVLAGLAATVSPRVLRGAGPSRRRPPASSTSTSPGGAATSTSPVDLQLAHGFRRDVLEHLRDIEYGATESYAEVAAADRQPAGRARPSAAPAPPTRCPSSSRATASSAATARSAATAAARRQADAARAGGGVTPIWAAPVPSTIR